MKIFSTSQIRNIDRLTIGNEPVSSINLMERASNGIFRWVARNIDSKNKIVIFAGTGNNGGDGLALARMLIETGYYVEVYLLESAFISADCQENINRLGKQGITAPIIVSTDKDFPIIENDSVLIDSLFGSGLTRPLSGLTARLIDYINRSGAKIISIDMPSGLFGEFNPYPNINSVIRANITLTLQFPKLSFFFAENYQYIGEFVIIPIGLNADAITSTESQYQYIDNFSIAKICRTRRRFSHKGDYGHGLIIAGSKGMMGAAVLASAACIKTGSGLVTAHVPKVGYSILQQSIPEVMVQEDLDENHFSSINSTSKYSAVAIGPGLGAAQTSVAGFSNLLKEIQAPLIIDADGLNILAENHELFDLLPAMTIITPHPGEFDRLFGESESGHQRLIKAIDVAFKYNIVIVLKGAYSQVVSPEGGVYFNSTGNPGMATGGSGDVLTGIITSLRGQGYDPIDSSLFGVYLHGLAGDLAVKDKSLGSITAYDIINNISKALNLIHISRDE